MEVFEGQTGLLPLTLEGSHVPYIGQLEVGDRRGLLELQVGLPGDEMGSRRKVDSLAQHLLCASCQPGG